MLAINAVWCFVHCYGIFFYRFYRILFFERKKIDPWDWKFFFGQTLFFFLALLSLSYSDHKHEGFNSLLRAAPLVLFPLSSMFSSGIDKKKFKNILLVYVGSTVSVCIYFCFFLFSNYNWDYIFSGSLVYHVTKSQRFYLDVHPTFTSIHFVVGTLIGLSFIQSKKSNNKIKTLLVLVLLLFLLGVIVFSSKFVILVYLASVFGLGLYYFARDTKGQILAATTFFLIIFLMFQSETISNKFQDFGLSLIGKSSVNASSTNIRKVLLACSTDLISSNWLFGYGLGSELFKVKECLEMRNITEITGVHNYFLRLWLSSGIVTLLAFGFSIYLNLFGRSSYSHKSLFFAISFIFVSAMLIEDYLSRAYGIALYGFVNCIFMVSSKSNLKDN